MPSESEHDTAQASISAWKEREDAEDALERYLSDAPSMSSITIRVKKRSYHLRARHCHIRTRPTRKREESHDFGYAKGYTAVRSLAILETTLGILISISSKALIIDVGELAKASSDASLVSALANQTGYWPVFSFLNSMNNLIDLASVGLIGQKSTLVQFRLIYPDTTHFFYSWIEFIA